MRSKLAVLLILLIFPLLMVTTAVQADDGSGYSSTSSQSVVVDSFGFPPYGTLKTFRFCAADGFGGRWHLTASSGTITGTRDNIGDCVWNISGNNTGATFHMNLILTSGSPSCCSTGYTDGIASKRTRSATGETYWTGSCNGGPYTYDWTQCP